MNRRQRHDVVVVGGGVVGAACALALARLGLSAVLIEAAAPPVWSSGSPDLRVYAMAPDNAAWLDGLGIWSAVLAARSKAYRRMQVCDGDWSRSLVFDADPLGRHALGWIVEHSLLVERLWSALPEAGVHVHNPGQLQGLERGDAGVGVLLQDGTRYAARLAIAADGGNSTLRTLAGVGTRRHDYRQRGVVAYIETGRPHEDTAWQRFLPGGPLAFLPFVDGLSSIVWSLPEDEAARVLQLDDALFSDELERAFAGRLGPVRPHTRRVAFPLRRQLSTRQIDGRVLILGDAAHVVHPLAGQGMNLGLRDVAGLHASIGQALQVGKPWDSNARLQRWARERRSENALATYGFEAINAGFSNDRVLPTLLRGPALGLVGKVPPLTHALWRRAAGV